MTERTLFGTRLRLARERRKLSIERIAEETKLSSSLIAALEDGTCRRWPAGLYSRSYVRGYAALVGLDPAETVEEFATLFPDLAVLNIDRAARGDALALGAPAPAPRVARPPVAPIRLFLDATPAPWWSRLLTRLAWWLHGVANGGRAPALEGADADTPAWSLNPQVDP
ncbi:MAG: helix-turn-helix domain-containing protein [Acidobacteria bacterium]|nr:helix-turn-helix domain-containing protein [Acidobacteriota bacterium]